jgi:hypothetical protein
MMLGETGFDAARATGARKRAQLSRLHPRAVKAAQLGNNQTEESARPIERESARGSLYHAASSARGGLVL